jgi:predicted metal-dependent hydrolase
MTSRAGDIVIGPEAMGELQKAVAEFNSWRFYDCHETLEDVWRELGGKSGRTVSERGAEPNPAPRGRLKPSATSPEVADFLQGIIKAAAGFHHVLRGNHKGAVNLLSDSLRLLEDYRPACLGVDVEVLVGEVGACLRRIEELGKDRLREFDRGMIPRIEMTVDR